MPAKKEYTNAELMEIGRKLIESRAKQSVTKKSTNTIKSKLYAAWKAGDKTPINQFKV